jgi:2,3-bisphosphoglycerate-independent phosphoglycerate mutase
VENKTEKVVLIVMDGVGCGDGGAGDAVAAAKTPNLDRLLAECPHTRLKAHGTAVGLPSDDDMGNSEVGHNTLGCGQVYAQGAKLVGSSIESGRLFQGDTWKALVENCVQNGRTMHFLGLLSDGNVHSNLSHLIAMLRRAKEDGVARVRCHILLDGRDVPATSALTYVDELEACLSSLRGDDFDCAIASGGGRMQITMDRYEADWSMVQRGWDIHVHGIGRQFATARDAIETYRAEFSCIDQDLPGFVIAKDGKPVGTIQNGDSVILFNFRGDRALEISRAFDDPNFDRFDRGDCTDVLFAGMLEYDSDQHIPSRYLVAPPDIQNTLTELLCAHGIREFAVSETQKFGHVTYFWNGNRSGKISDELETYQEIPSDVIPFDQAPEMKARQITAALIAAMESEQYQFLRCNYPNGDMVGHTGVFSAVVTAVEAVDTAIGQVAEAAERLGYTLLITADHGNSDQMLETDKKGNTGVRTAHSLNPVPLILVEPNQQHALKEGSYGLANVAATVAELLGLTPPSCWEESLLQRK